MNKVVLTGNLTRDPEYMQTASGLSLCKFTIAVQRKYANDKGEYEADFLNITAWRHTAEYCGKYLRKGMKVCVAGSLQTGSYEDKNGVKRYTTDVVADEAEILKANKDEGAQAQTEPHSAKKGKDELKPTANDEGLPF